MRMPDVTFPAAVFEDMGVSDISILPWVHRQDISSTEYIKNNYSCILDIADDSARVLVQVMLEFADHASFRIGFTFRAR